MIALALLLVDLLSAVSCSARLAEHRCCDNLGGISLRFWYQRRLFWQCLQTCHDDYERWPGCLPGDAAQCAVTCLYLRLRSNSLGRYHLRAGSISVVFAPEPAALRPLSLVVAGGRIDLHLVHCDFLFSGLLPGQYRGIGATTLRRVGHLQYISHVHL